MRSALGVTGIVLMVALCLKTPITLLMQCVALKLAAVVSGMLGVPSYADTLEGLSRTLGIALLALVTTLVMYLACIGLVMGVFRT